MLRSFSSSSCLLAALLALACASTATQKSTGSNWLGCKADSDCTAVAGATCGADDYCVDASGERVLTSSVAGSGGSGSGGASGDGGSGGASGDGGATGGAASGGAASGGTSSGGTAAGGASTGGLSGDGGDGGSSAGGTGGSGAGGAGATSMGIDCYSPAGWNLETAGQPGSIGCECRPGTADVCLPGDLGLSCVQGRWAVAAEACSQCAGPYTPERFEFRNDLGCACDPADTTGTCIVTGTESRILRCVDGKFVLTDEQAQCTCSSDRQCGTVGGVCLEGSCVPQPCDVNGIRYGVGAVDIPDPLSCNTCTCMADGSLYCTQNPCPVEQCPAGTEPGSPCVVCDETDQCHVRRTGCLPHCDTDVECGFYYLTRCDPVRHVCTTDGCRN